MVLVPPVLQPIIHRLSSPFTGLPVPIESVPSPSPELCVENSLWCDDVMHTVTNSLDTNHTINDLLRHQTYSPAICSINGKTNSSLPQSTRDQLNHNNMIFRNILLQLHIEDLPKLSSKPWGNFDGSDWEQDSHGKWKHSFNNNVSLPSSSTPHLCVLDDNTSYSPTDNLQFTIQSNMGANRNVTNNRSLLLQYENIPPYPIGGVHTNEVTIECTDKSLIP